MPDIWPDGESVPPDQVTSVFRQPCGLPRTFSRSSLVIGVRGAGKTLLLRYHEKVHEGVAIYVVLSDVLSSFPKQTALGPLRSHVNPSLQPMLEAKAAALIVTAIASELLKAGVEVAAAAILDCLPPILRRTEGLAGLCLSVSRASLDDFDNFAYELALRTFMRHAANQSRIRGPLLILLDRGDNVSPATLLPVFHLLDQSPGFVAVAALRPGHGGTAFDTITQKIIPGDQYDLHQLGLEPRSGEWTNFVFDAVCAQRADTANAPPDIRELIAVVSRDSVRAALELFQSGGRPSDSSEYRSRIEDAIGVSRDLLLTNAQRLLKAQHPDFRAWLRQLRQQATATALTEPIVINLVPSTTRTLFEKKQRLQNFAESAFRLNVLCMPSGHRWIPGTLPSEFEVQPLLLWRPGDSFSLARPAQIMDIVESSVFSVGGPRPQARHIFVAYRMQDDHSRRFLNQIRGELHQRPNLRQWNVLTGDSPAGSQWPNIVRDRLKTSELVVADVTGAHNDVLFEVGFATGLELPYIPVVETEAGRKLLPRWLQRHQLPPFDDAGGMAAIVASIDTALTDPAVVKPTKLPPPVPERTTFVGSAKWLTPAIDQFRAECGRHELVPTILSYDDKSFDDLVRHTLNASLLVLALDATHHDAAAHYIAGAALARTTVGGGRGGFERRVLFIQDPEVSAPLTAESVYWCAPVLRNIPVGTLVSEIRTHADTRRGWLKRHRETSRSAAPRHRRH